MGEVGDLRSEGAALARMIGPAGRPSISSRAASQAAADTIGGVLMASDLQCDTAFTA
jgi:hypothetical protein